MSAAKLLTTAQIELEARAATECPVCGRDHESIDGDPDELFDGSQPDPADDIHRAAHCCLWKSHDHAARVRIAERVEGGSTWADAIEGENHAI